MVVYPTSPSAVVDNPRCGLPHPSRCSCISSGQVSECPVNPQLLEWIIPSPKSFICLPNSQKGRICSHPFSEQIVGRCIHRGNTLKLFATCGCRAARKVPVNVLVPFCSPIILNGETTNVSKDTPFFPEILLFRKPSKTQGNQSAFEKNDG